MNNSLIMDAAHRPPFNATPLIDELISLRETLWFNPKLTAFSAASERLPLNASDMVAASERLQRFAPYLALAFPETAASGGIIESELVSIDRMKAELERRFDIDIPGRFLLKCDSHLPISGSIKARGGIYEVLLHAERLALDSGLLEQGDSYTCFASDRFRALFSTHGIVVGSTGNLGLSIGIMSARLGFRVTVHMSADARQWKKDLLREKGVKVVEHASDYSVAVAQGREEAMRTPDCHFIDDEDSTSLFLGYSVAALRLKRQLDDQGIAVDDQHPLFVYLPCGVGGGPGGVAFGLKQLFGDAVHCFFAEPTHSPCMLLGMHTGLHNGISVQDIGIDNLTCADGLAVGRPSAFIGRIMEPLLDGIYTVDDDALYRFLALIKDAEGLDLEPSSVAGVPGVIRLLSTGEGYLRDSGLADRMDSACHIVWATGGSMVPEPEYRQYYTTGQALIAKS